MAILTTLVVAFGIRLISLSNKSQTMNPSLGIKDSKLQKCPDNPNCINSFYNSDQEHFLPPIKTELNIEQIKETILSSSLKWKIYSESENYIHFTNKSGIMGFVDDIELYLIGNTLHFRSASRVGKSDLGANKKRMITLKTLF